MRLLLKKGADPNLTTRDGNTALVFAAGVGYRDKNTRGTESQALEAVKLTVSLGMESTMQITGARRRCTARRSEAPTPSFSFWWTMARNPTRKRSGITPLDFAMGKNVVAQLPVPHDSTVALIRKLGGVEGKLEAKEAKSAQ